MVDWKTYKDQEPFEVIPQSNKFGYINNPTFVPIATPIHEPCGYWYSVPGGSGGGNPPGPPVFRNCEDDSPLTITGPSSIDGAWGFDTTCTTTGGAGYPIAWTLRWVSSYTEGHLTASSDTTSVTFSSTKVTGPCSLNPEGIVDIVATSKCGTSTVRLTLPEVSQGATGHIHYTTNQMSINQSQTLSTSDTEVGVEYSWAISSGGGTITQDGVYTAPATNPNCDNNPSISLRACGKIIDTLQIAVNAASPYATAIYECAQRSCPPCPDCYNYGSCFAVIRCSGNYSTVIPHNDGAICLGWSAYETYCAWYPSCTTFGLVVGYNDVRQPSVKAAGCCPWQLM
jgi:hypothetical protein